MELLPNYIGKLQLNKVNLEIDRDLTTIVEEEDINVSVITDNNEKKVLFKSPEVFTIDNVLNDEECEHFINLSKGNLKRALVSDNSKGIQSNGRTGSNYWIMHNKDDITKRVGEKIAGIVGIPLENAEAYQIVYYDVSQEYRQHYDCFDHDGSEKTLRCLKYGGQRMATALCYLNDVEEGGGTKLTKANIEISAKKGKLLVFRNVYEGTNIRHPLSEHAGLPVIKGYKYAFNLWFRECSRNMLYRDFNPKYYDFEKKTDLIKQENINIDISGVELLDANNGIFKITDFLSNAEKEFIISKCNFDLTKERASCWIKKEHVPNLVDNVKKLLNVEINNLENLNVVRYSKLVMHREHFDAYDLNTDNGKKCTATLGQRVATFSVVIKNNLEYGFSRIGKNIVLNEGTALFYNNVINNTHTRNPNVIKSIINKEHDESIVLHIYARDNTKKSITQESKVICNEDYMDTYNTVLQLFKNDQVSPGWREYKSFKIALMNMPYEHLCNYVKRLILEKENYKEFGILRKENLDCSYNFDEYNPVIVNNVLEDSAIDIFKDYYRESIKNGYFILGDNQSNRYKSNNEGFSRFLHYEILPLIEKIVGKKLKPTYSYLSAYTKDADLPPHTDRPDCEYTVSFIVDKPDNVRWPIYFDKEKQPIKGKGRYSEKPDKANCVECDCGANGLMIFNGRDHIHYREPLEYDYYNILLLHYKGYND